MNSTLDGLSSEDIALLELIDTHRLALGSLAVDLKAHRGIDPRWLSIGITDLQKGLMALERAVIQPEGF